MKYPYVLFFRYDNDSYIDTFFETNKDKLLCANACCTCTAPCTSMSSMGIFPRFQIRSSSDFRVP